MPVKKLITTIIPILVSLIMSCNQSTKKVNMAYKKSQTAPSPNMEIYKKYNSKKPKKKKSADTNNFLTFIEKIPQKTRDELKQSLPEITSPRMKQK